MKSCMLFEAQNLACRRNARPVFRNVAFALEAGDALLVTGSNGSGKSSFLRILAGLLPPALGDLQWNGKPIEWPLHRQQLHYLGHHDALKPELTVSETLGFWRLLRPKPSYRPIPPSLGLDALANRPVRILSAGQKRRLALARLLIDDVPLWLLDEPTAALDQAGQRVLIDLLRMHRLQGGIAVLATHHGLDLPDAYELALPGASG